MIYLYFVLAFGGGLTIGIIGGVYLTKKRYTNELTRLEKRYSDLMDRVGRMGSFIEDQLVTPNAEQLKKK